MDRLFDILSRNEELFVLIFFLGTWVASTIREARRSRREAEKRRRSLDPGTERGPSMEGRGETASGGPPPSEPVLFPEPEPLEEAWSSEAWGIPVAEESSPPPPPVAAPAGVPDLVSLDDRVFRSSLEEDKGEERFEFLDSMAEEIASRQLGQIKESTGTYELGEPGGRRGWRPRGGWREGVILREILGPPRALGAEDLPGLR